MAKREWIGKPWDATMQYITERPNKGETVGGTTEDDLGDEMTESIPSFIDTDEYSAKELKMLQMKILHPKLSLKELTDRFNLSYTDTSSFLAGFRREYEQELKESGIYEKLWFPNSPREETGRESEPESVVQQERNQAYEFFRENPQAEIRDAMEAIDPEHLSQSALAGAKGNARQSLRAEGVDLDGRDETESRTQASRQDVEMEMETEVEPEMETRVETEPLIREPNQSENGFVTVEIKADSLFSIVTSSELPEDERRDLFEQVVG